MLPKELPEVPFLIMLQVSFFKSNYTTKTTILNIWLMFDSGSPTVITELRQSPRLHAKQPQAKVMSLWQ